jgi:plastocyanin
MLPSRQQRKAGALRLRNGLILGIVALLGAATVVLPAIASSETPPTVTAYSYKYLPEEKEKHYWLNPNPEIAKGGTVTFTNASSEHRHGLKFTGGPAGATPECKGLTAEMGEVTGALNWQAECSFSAPGTYTFVCTVHPTEMTGTVVVAAAAGGTTTTTTTLTTPTGTTTTPGSPPPGGSTETGQLLAGAASSAVRVARAQHGHGVHGSLDLSQAAAGGTLVLELLAPRASLASAGGAKPVQVGKLTRLSLHPGQFSFTVPLSTRARRALHRHGHLALRLRIRLSSAAGGLTELRSVTLHA